MKRRVKNLTAAVLTLCLLITSVLSPGAGAVLARGDGVGSAAQVTASVEADRVEALESPGTESTQRENPGTELSQGENPGTELSQGENPGTELSQGENPGMELLQGENPGTELSQGEVLETELWRGENPESPEAGETAASVRGDESSGSSGHEMPQVERKAEVSVAVKNSRTASEAVLEAGEQVILQVQAFHTLDAAAELKLYFWDYAGKLPEAKDAWKELLTKPCTDIMIQGKYAETTVSLEVTYPEGKDAQVQAHFVQEVKGDTVAACYLAAELSPDMRADFEVSVSSDAARQTVVVPVITADSGDTCFDAAYLAWEQPEADTADFEEEEAEAGTEHFLETAEGTKQLNISDFAAARLVVLADSADTVIDPEHMIANYGDIYLLQYNSVEQAMNAYVYYAENAAAVEPDTVLETAGETGTGSMEVTQEINPIAALSEEPDSAPALNAARVIALIDTGARESANVIDRVSLIDEVLEGNGHGNAMAAAIVSQNPDAKILSVRAMGNDGRGTVSSIAAAMEYAMNQKVSIINLSLYAKTNLRNSVLASEIQKAVNAGIIVVGSAGNDGTDASGYMPGSVECAYIIGAADANGVRLGDSNYGATVDYNVTAGSTSEAAAKFSGFISLYGIDGIVINDGLIYETDYIPAEEETDEDISADADTEEYPASGSVETRTEYVWRKDTQFDFTAYHPYGPKVDVACLNDMGETDPAKSTSTEWSYECVLLEKPDYTWILKVCFVFIEEREMATVQSESAQRLLPEVVTQKRNAGYGGIVPELAGDTVEGKTYTALVNDTDFDVAGLLLDYNPYTFKVNGIVDSGGFDISRPGSYTVIYEISYFLFCEYTWYVKNTVKVVDPSRMEPGIYLTSKESTLMLRSKSDGQYAGYGDFIKLKRENGDFIVSCIDEEYEAAVSSSSASVTAEEICKLTDLDDHTKLLSVVIPEELPEEAVILSVFRPNYQTMKMHMGGGWQDSGLSESELGSLSEEDFAVYEEELSRGAAADEYMDVAASWKTVQQKKFSSAQLRSSAWSGSYNYFPSGASPCVNTGTVYATKKASEIVTWVNSQGYEVKSSQIKNYKVACTSGHNYYGMPPSKTYSCSITVQIQQKGDAFRVKLFTSFSPGSGYQNFSGSTVFYVEEKPGGLKIYKKFTDPEFAASSNLIGELKAVFTVYDSSSCGDGDEVGTITVSGSKQSGASGTLDNLEEGDYWIKETSRIEGTVWNHQVYGPVHVKAGETAVLGVTIYNKAMFFEPSIPLLTKVRKDTMAPLPGAIFKVEYSDTWTGTFISRYTWYFKTDASGKVYYDNSHYLPAWNGSSSDALLKLSDGTPSIPQGRLRITEVEAPPGYKTEGEAHTVSIGTGGYSELEKAWISENLVISNEEGSEETEPAPPPGGDGSILKKSTAGDEILALDSYSLEGAQFEVYINGQGYYATLTADANGMTGSVTLPFPFDDEAHRVWVTVPPSSPDGDDGYTYSYVPNYSATVSGYVKEVKAPEGHKLNETPVFFSQTMWRNDTDRALTTVIEIEDSPVFADPGRFHVVKKSGKGNPIDGAIFRVCYYDAPTADPGKLVKTWYLQSRDGGDVKFDEAHLAEGRYEYQSDPFFTWNGKIVIPVGGYLEVQEVEAPAEYIVDDAPFGFATTETVVMEGRQYNDPEPCEIRLKKCDTDGVTPLENVEFELMYASEEEPYTSDAVPSFCRLLKVGQSITGTTDSNGEIRFSNLDQGTYRITEIRTSPGHTLLKDPIYVKLPIRWGEDDSDDASGNVDDSCAKSDGATGTLLFFSCLYEITNTAVLRLPMTGSSGTWTYGFAGMAIAAVLGTGMAVGTGRRRKCRNCDSRK